MQVLKNALLIESSATKVEFLTELFMDQNKPVVTERREFQKRHTSKLIITLGNFWTIKILMQDRINSFSREWLGTS